MPFAVLVWLLDGCDDDAGAEETGAVDAGALDAVDAGALDADGVAAGVGVAVALTYTGGSKVSFGCPFVATFM